jgi:hypothetical protein
MDFKSFVQEQAEMKRRFEENHDRIVKAQRGIAVLSVIGSLIGFAFFGVVCYVAAHFIAKVW